MRQRLQPYLCGGLAVAIEAGNQTAWIYDLLVELGAEVTVVNPTQVKLIAESRRKTDKVDARILCELLRLNGLPHPVHVPDGPTRELRGLLVARRQLISVALATAMRRAELLNCIWGDVDFDAQTIEVNPKQNTEETWEWLIKDADRRTFPLTEEIAQMLVDHQTQQPEGYPYVFVPRARYDHIQNVLRPKGKWTQSDSRLKVVNNFRRSFDRILRKAGVKA